MLKHKHLLIPIFLSVTILGYTKYVNADGCFWEKESKKVFSDLKNMWWTRNEQNKLVINFHSLQLVQQGDESECVVLIDSRDKNDICHACSVNLGIAIYSKNGKVWKKIFEQKNVAQIGQFGKLPEVKTVQIGEDNIGIMFYDTHMGQGYYSEGYNLIARVDGKYKEVIQIATHSDNRGFAEGFGIVPYEWDAQYEFIEGDNKQFFDIKVARKGTDEEWVETKRNITPINEINVYKFIDGKYEIVKN